MEKQDFQEEWKSIGEQHLYANQLNKKLFKLDPVSSNFLFTIGMPSEFQDLNFDYLKEKKLENVNQLWSLDDTKYNKYLSIGFNGSGDSISINLENHELVYLNHDNYWEEEFVNSDLEKFALTVLRVNAFAQILTKVNSASFFETEYSDEKFDELIIDLKNVDSKIFESKKSHWRYVLDNYKWYREEARATAASKT